MDLNNQFDEMHCILDPTSEDGSFGGLFLGSCNAAENI